jgi:2-methylcitrate dehydratase PrpD
VACILVRGRLTLAEFGPAALADPLVRTTMERIELVVDPAAHGERQTVEIDTHDGRHLRDRVETPRGHWDNPLTDAELTDKFLELAAPVLGNAAPAAVAAVEALDAAPTVKGLLDRLRPPRRA